MGFVLKKVLDVSICLFNHCGCLRHDKEHTLREFHRQYRVCGEIGSGGFGRVYKVSLSFLIPSVNGWTMAERRIIPTEICFIEECQDVQGVVRLIGWFASRRGFLIVMERPANFMDLFDLINTFGWLEERMARGLFVQIVDTVVELYKKHSVIHRDIKDENVVVDLDSGTVWLVDFGAAELLERAKKQCFQGTLSYSPPEVFKRDCFYPLEGTVWSLGILLYLLVVGKPPFRNELQICTGKLRFPRNVSSECRAIIRRCLCPSPEGRLSLEELQQSEWILNNETTDSFFATFEAQWRKRKRYGSLNSNGVYALSDDGAGDDDEDCSYRTEAGAVPGPLTIPPLFGGISSAHRSTTTTNSLFVEQNSSHSEEVEENAAVERTEQNSTPELAAADTRSSPSSSSLAISDIGFETAPEYDEWKYASFSSSNSMALDICNNFETPQHQNFPRENQCSTLDHRNSTLDFPNDTFGRRDCAPSISMPFVRFGICDTQSDMASASFCSFSSSSDREARRNSFTSDDSFNSSTTYFSANSLENFGEVSPSNQLLMDEIEKNEDDDDEKTLRTEQPNIVMEWRKETSEEEEEEWDETIRENIGNWVEKRAEKEEEEIGKDDELEEREDEQQTERSDEQWVELVEEERFGKDDSFEWSELAEGDELLKDGRLHERNDELLEEEGPSSAFPPSRAKWEKEQTDKSLSKRKGGDRYRRRRNEAKTEEATKFDGRRRRRMTSPPVIAGNCDY
ncbi:hypothetical protein niasHS_010244 [Heterodera schachtii]|uniref:Serine/threonine-protein kinase 1 n=1 Tax=Heterodera schachtii TaxID=97005 RepID=A0ABD2J461_HETSC